jgi:prevent-host-death family protein
MKSIGLRELRQHASQYLRQVEAGRSIEITTRGRVVALLVPVRGSRHVDRLVHRGRVVPPTKDLMELGPPLASAPGRQRPSTVLARMRRRER